MSTPIKHLSVRDLVDDRETFVANLYEGLTDCGFVVLRDHGIAKADLDTALIQREAAVLFEQEKIGAPIAMAGAIAFTLQQEKALETADPFSRRDGWRSHGPVSRSFEFEFHGQPHKAQLTYQHDGSLQLALNGQALSLYIEPAADGLLVILNGQRAHLQVYRLGEQVHLFSAGGATQITVIDLLAHAGVAQQVFLATDAAKAMRELGMQVPASASRTHRIFGRDFDPAQAEAYLNSFAIRRS